MRMIFSFIGLIIVLAIVGFLAKSQLSSGTQLPNSAPSSPHTAVTPANIAQQSKQMQAQVKDQVNEAMKAAADAQQKVLDGENADKPADKTGSAY